MIKRNNKKKLCLIIDVYDWAFHNIAKEIQKILFRYNNIWIIRKNKT